jgi:uncharacterized lipoprotein YmbA
MSPSPHQTFLWLIVMALLTACASPPSHFYTLSASHDAPVGPAFSATIVVGPVSIPDSVNRPEMVVQVGPNQVALDEFNRWASPLKSEIQRVIIQNLTGLLGTPTVFRYPQGPVTSPDFRVEIEVLRFDSSLGSVASIDAIWTVHGKSKDNVTTGRTTTLETPRDTSYQALAAAHSRALHTVSRDVAEAILVREGGAR